MTKEAGDIMTPGTHGTTYGGNPLAMAIANAVFDELSTPSFLENVTKMGILLKNKLKSLQKKFPKIISEIRGVGLMLGMQINSNYNNDFIVKKFIENKLLTIPAGNNVVRFLPPLIINEFHINEAYDKVLASLNQIN